MRPNDHATADPLADRTRNRCRRLLITLLGEGGMQRFLRQPQPDLGDRTGTELLQTDPEDLFRRLKAIGKNSPYEP